MMNKDIIDVLADALLGTGSIKAPEVSQKWYVCISDGKGGYNQHETTSLFQAEASVKDWLAAGWPAWIQDANGQHLVLAKKPKGKN
tara:strand:+ start:2176 stop:2433 length:258 start_codon:yes stop_codon:yes gene_type:complete